ncbi:MAG: hypothetical protein EBV69_02925, partial [Oxalobacteraceae bacterium]|nr:hypothetical protein [Oxalobacteraceae bacterium]
MGSGAFSDAVGNTNQDGADGDNAVSFTVDTLRPTVVVSADASSLKAGESTTVRFTVSESVTNFDITDVARVAGGQLSNFGGSGTGYTATYTPLSNSTTTESISVGGGAFVDAAGNDNAASNAVSITVDTLRPTV